MQKFYGWGEMKHERILEKINLFLTNLYMKGIYHIHIYWVEDKIISYLSKKY